MELTEKERLPLLERARALGEENTVTNDKYLGITVSGCARELDVLIKTAGIRPVCLALAEGVCKKYLQLQGEEYPLTEACIAYEIEYHLDCYLHALGIKGYFWERHLSTWLFPRKIILRRCECVDIYAGRFDYKPWEPGYWECILFRYKKGLRK